MWHDQFGARLQAWHELRADAKSKDIESALMDINDWWWQVPTVNHYLHWDDISNWPGPWDLLADDVYCDVARALGMLYTVRLIEHDSIQHFSLAQTDKANLVLINDGKYILNWCPRQLLNINSSEFRFLRIVTDTELKKQIKL